MSMSIFPDGKYGEATEAAYREVIRAIELHPSSVPFACPHQAYAILLEEVDEMWAEIKANNRPLSVYEAVQVAAMAIRYVAEFGHYPYSKPDKSIIEGGL